MQQTLLLGFSGRVSGLCIEYLELDRGESTEVSLSALKGVYSTTGQATPVTYDQPVGQHDAREQSMQRDLQVPKTGSLGH